MRHRAYDTDKWNGWQKDFSEIPLKAFRTAPLAVSCEVDRLDVFAVEESHGLVWHASWNTSTGSEDYEGTQWGQWQSIGRLSIIGVDDRIRSSHTSDMPGPTDRPDSTSRTARPPAISTAPAAESVGRTVRRCAKTLTILVLMAVMLGILR